MKYRMTLRNHLRALDLLIFTLVGIFAFGWYQANQNNLDDSLIEGLIVFGLVTIIPVLYLHLEYYFFSRGVEIEIDAWSKSLKVSDKTGTHELYNFDDLSKIIVYMPPYKHSKSMFIRIPFDTYHYARIFTKSGKEIIFTSLMDSKVDEVIRNIRGVPIELKKRLPASILIR